MTEQQTYRLPKAAPFHNEGNTAAGWTLTVGASLAVLVIGIGIIVSPVLAYVGVGLLVLACAASFILSKTGHGQPRSLTNTAKAGAWYED